MKNLLPAAIAAVCLFSACTVNDTNTETTVTADTSLLPYDTAALAPGTVTFGPEMVPDTIKTSFAAKYPAAKDTKWEQYTAAEDDQLETGKTYYYVTFYNPSDYMSVWYDDQWMPVRTKTRVKGDSRLPDAVNRMLNEKYPGYKMEEVDKENDKNMDMYELKFMHNGNKVKMHVLPNGTIYSRKVS